MVAAWSKHRPPAPTDSALRKCKTMTIRKYKQTRNWAIYDQSGELIAVTLYKKGAQEIVRRLTATQVAA